MDPDARLKDAKRRLFLSPEEETMYGLHLHNLWSDDGYSHPDGGRSTYYMTPYEEGGKHYALPGVSGGQLLSKDDSVAMAKKVGLHHFPSYTSRKALEDRYKQLHEHMEQDTNDWEAVRSGPQVVGDSQIAEGYAEGGEVDDRPPQHLQRWRGRLVPYDEYEKEAKEEMRRDIPKVPDPDPRYSWPPTPAPKRDEESKNVVKTYAKGGTVRPVHHETAYDKAHEATPLEKAKRAARGRARYAMIKKFGEAALRGKEVDHIKSFKGGGSNEPSNWRIRDASSNRADKTF